MHLSQTNHPPSLRIFFATEMWERYGFYVVQTLLALYLVRHFNWDDKTVYALVGSFTALTYVSPIVGGWIADHLLGQKRTIVFGGAILLLNYLILGVVAKDSILILSLAGIAVGTGLFKPNISSLLGNEYPEDSPIRENGFTIFYMGITSGIILGCTLPSQLTYYFGWPTAFVSAAVGIVVGLMVFVFGVKRLHIKDYNLYEHDLKKIIQATVAAALLWVGCFGVLHFPMLADLVFICIALLSVAYFIFSIKRATGNEARTISVIGLLCITSVIFWTFYFQMFLSLTLFISRVVEPTLFGIRFPAPYYVSVQSFGAVIIGYLLSRRIHRSTAKKSNFQSGNKFLLAMLSITIAFALIAVFCHFSLNEKLLSPLFFIPVYLIISLAELLLYPVGLSAVTVLAPRKRVSTMMGIFLVSLGVGGFLSGKLADLAAISPGETSVIALKAQYAIAFSNMTYFLIAAFFVSAILNLAIRSLMNTPVPKPI